jgi:predicted RNA-binding protein with PUA-like domain
LPGSAALDISKCIPDLQNTGPLAQEVIMGKKPDKKPDKKHWLMKSEPETYSIDDLKRDKKTLWEGVRNYQARNFMMKDMQVGDEVLFYHSNANPPGIAGTAVVSRAAVPDPSALNTKSDYFDPKASVDHPIWFCVEVQFKQKFKSLLPLEDLRKAKALAKMPLLQKGQRLSVQPVSAAEYAHVLLVADKALGQTAGE